MQGFQAHHDVLYDNITIEDLYVHTNYFTSGDIWSNAWFTWKGTGKTTGEDTLIEVTLIINGKMVRLQSYRPITVNMPSKMKLLLMPLHRTKLDTHSLSGYLIGF